MLHADGEPCIRPAPFLPTWAMTSLDAVSRVKWWSRQKASYEFECSETVSYSDLLQPTEKLELVMTILNPI